VVIALNIAWELSSIARFANGVIKTGGLQSSAVQNTPSKPETPVSQMAEIIGSLDDCFCWPEHNFDRHPPLLSRARNSAPATLFETTPDDGEQHAGDDTDPSQEAFMKIKLTQNALLCGPGCASPFSL